MIFLTGDCHSEFDRLSSRQFPVQREMTRDDYVIVCGDFGLFWTQDSAGNERYWLKFLKEKGFTILFADGNHENFDKLDRFEVTEFHGGRVHKIADNIYHLMRGEVFDIDGKRFFVMGGGASHDFDRILQENLYGSHEESLEAARLLRKRKIPYRILGDGYWFEELPSEEELQNGLRHLKKVNFEVDYVITHCAPLSVLKRLRCARIEDNSLTRWFDSVLDKLTFDHWYFGHYHENMEIDEKFTMLYRKVVPLR